MGYGVARYLISHHPPMQFCPFVLLFDVVPPMQKHAARNFALMYTQPAQWQALPAMLA